jgi:2-methylcitrate dehydratase PrpD
MTAIGLIKGSLTAADYSDSAAADPRIDALRAKMICREDARYTGDYLDPAKRSIANAVQVFFSDGTATAKAEVEYPLGHKRRRKESIPHLLAKLETNLATRFPKDRVQSLLALFQDTRRLRGMSVPEFIDRFLP